MPNSKLNFEDYQEGGFPGESFFRKKKPPPVPTPRNPFANAQLLTPPSVLVQQRAAEEARRQEEEKKRQEEAERKKKYGMLSDYSVARQAIDAKAKAAAAAERVAKKAVAVGTAAMTSKPKLRVMMPLDADLSNDINTPITHTDFTITYNNLMELYKKYDTPLSSVESGERLSNELKILRSLAGESFTKTEECITNIFNALVQSNKIILSDNFDINDINNIKLLENVKKTMHSLSERSLPNTFEITNLISDYVKNNYKTINSTDTLSSTNTEILKFYIRMLIIIFYPKIILDMISDKMIDYIVAIKEKRDDLLDGGDDNINSIIERLLGKPSYGLNYGYRSIPGPSRGASFRTVSSDSSVRTDQPDFFPDFFLGSDDDNVIPPASPAPLAPPASPASPAPPAPLAPPRPPAPPGLIINHVGGAPDVRSIFKKAINMKAFTTAAPGGADPAAAAAAPGGADPAAAPGGADGAAPGGADGAAPGGADGDGDADSAVGTDDADSAVGTDGDGDLSSRPTNPLISFLNSDNPYIQQSGFIFYNALTNFAVSIGIYNNKYKEYIVNKLQEIIRDKFGIIDDDEKGKDYEELKTTHEKEYNAARDALTAIPDGKKYLQLEDNVEVLQKQYNDETSRLEADNTLSSNDTFMEAYNTTQNSLDRAKYELGFTRFQIERITIPKVADSVVDYLNAKLKLKIASEEPDTQKEMSEAFIKLLALNKNKNFYFDKILDDIYYVLITNDNMNRNYTLALNKYITSGIGKSIMFQFNVPKSVAEVKPKSSSLISRIMPFSRNAKGGKRGTRRYKKRAGTRRQKKRRGTHRKRKNTTK